MVTSNEQTGYNPPCPVCGAIETRFVYPMESSTEFIECAICKSFSKQQGE